MDGKVNYPRFLLCKKTHKKHLDRRNNNFSKSVENRGSLQNSQGGTMGKFSKMADFLGKLWKAKKMGNTSRTIA